MKKLLIEGGRRILRGTFSLLIVSAVLGTALGVAVFQPHQAQAGVNWTQQPAGMVASNNGASVPRKEVNNAQHFYGWQVTGPYVASVTSGSAMVISPSVMATNLPDGSRYQGPFRVIAYTTQQLNWMASSLTYGAAAQTYAASAGTPQYLTWVPSTYGLLATANSKIDSDDMGTLWPKSYVAMKLSPTVSATANNVVFWILDQDW